MTAAPANANIQACGSAAWAALQRHKDEDLKGVTILSLFDDPGRFGTFSRSCCGMLVDFSKTLMTEATFARLIGLARDVDLEHRRNEMLTGAAVNVTEDRAALHTALRRMDRSPVLVDGVNVVPQVEEILGRMQSFADGVHSGEWTGHSGKRFTDIVNLGIGGSDLGPRMVCEALSAYATHGITPHFVANVDGYDLGKLLPRLDPETTLFIVTSKSFSTQETMRNAHTARRWFVDKTGRKDAIAKHFVAVSTNVEAVAKFGIDPARTFGFWNWVGGRFSLWSAVGLPIALTIGMKNFNALRQGAFDMDRHFADTPLEDNVPVILGLLGIWHVNFLNYPTAAVLPYAENLRLFPDYCQQSHMESSGKSVRRDGTPASYQTSPVIWGGAGTNVQHSFFQYLHQGTGIVPADFIGVAKAPALVKDHHRLLMANFFGQTEALMRGRSPAVARRLLAEQGYDAAAAAELAPHTTFPGGRPSVSILLEELTPETLGALIALYEHKVFVQGVIWDINSFDQFGVELGKRLASQIMEDGDETQEICGSTRALIKAYNTMCAKDDKI